MSCKILKIIGPRKYQYCSNLSLWRLIGRKIGTTCPMDCFTDLLLRVFYRKIMTKATLQHRPHRIMKSFHDNIIEIVEIHFSAINYLYLSTCDDKFRPAHDLEALCTHLFSWYGNLECILTHPIPTINSSVCRRIIGVLILTDN